MPYAGRRNLCSDPLTGQLLDKYDDVWAARIEQARRWFFNSIALRLELCVSCNFYHLLPELDEAQAEIEFCRSCKSKYGLDKVIHINSNHANAEKINLTSRVGLGTRIYPCPYGNGWHVTSNVDYDLFRAIRNLAEIRSDEIRKNSSPKDSYEWAFQKRDLTLRLKKKVSFDKSFDSAVAPSERMTKDSVGAASQRKDLDLRLRSQVPFGNSGGSAISPSERRASEQNYSVTSSDQLRIRSIIAYSKNIKKSPSGSNKEDLLNWAKTNNPFEAYFLAAYLKVPHLQPDFSDPMLAAKLKAWLAWASK